MLSTARALVLASHPIPTAGVTMLATALAVSVGHTAIRTALIAAAVLAGQLSIGWCNDAIDADRDRNSARRDKPVASGDISRRTVAVAAGVALAVTTPLSLRVGLAAGGVHLVTVAGGWAYDLGLKRTWLSWLPYAVAFAALPSCVVLALPGSPAPPWWLAVTGGLLGVGAHLANVLPDLEDDVATGVRGLPHRIGRRASCVLAAVLLGAASLVVALGPSAQPAAATAAGTVAAVGLAVAISVVGWRDPTSRRPFYGVLAIAVIDVGLLVLAGGTIIPMAIPA